MAIPVGGVHDITVYEAAGFREEFEVYEDDETTPIPFVDGSTGIAQLRTGERQSTRLLANFTVEIDDNKLSISLTSEEAVFDLNLSPVTGYYDIFVTEPDSEPIMFMEGKAKINPAVTEAVEPVIP